MNAAGRINATPEWYPIANFSAFVSPPKGRLMGAFKGYFDESGEDAVPHNAFAFCGYVSTVDDWKHFEQDWDLALKQNDAPYLHMKELQDPTGKLAAFAGKEGEERRNKLLGDLLNVLKKFEPKLKCAGSLIRLPDLREFNAEYQLNLEALPLAMYATMGELYKLYPDDTLELVVDRLDKYLPEKTIAKAAEYAASYIGYNPGERMSWLPLKEPDTFRIVLPLQAADFVAWEARKEHEMKNEWWRNRKRGLKSEEWVSNQVEWLLAQGKGWPNHRISFSLLASTVKIHAGVIDYDFLCEHHKTRRGIWTVEDWKRYLLDGGEQSS